ncbi:MAG: GAF domain-containing protein [Bacteroidia bacterium]|nr:GAF domain-containing protein [Bacteroidia bacterium]
MHIFQGINWIIFIYFSFYHSISVFCLNPAKNSNSIRGHFYHKNFTRKEYNAHNQNFDIVQAPNNIIYVANKQGVLSFDGKHWQTIKGTENRLFYSVACAKDGSIYAGGDGEIGQIVYASTGQPYFQSLNNFIPPQHRNFLAVWSIHPYKEGVIFQTEKYLFIWQHKRMKVISAPAGTDFFLGLIFQGNYYVHSRTQGLMKLVGEQLYALQGSLGHQNIIAILPSWGRGNEQFVVLSDWGFFYLYDGNEFILQKLPCDKLLQKYPPYYAIQLSDNNIAIATLEKGVFIVDPKGEVVAHFHKGNILQDNQVISLLEDREGGIWCALNNGITRIEWSIPITYFDASHGLYGSIKGIDIFQNCYYVATSLGLFSYLASTLTHNREPYFEMIQKVARQCWGVKAVHNGIIVAASDGALYIDEKQQVFTLDKNSYLSIASNSSNTVIYLGGEKILTLLTFEDNRWKVKRTLSGFSGNIRAITVQNDSTLWLTTEKEGVDKLLISSNGEYRITNYNQKHNVVNLNENLVFLWEGKVLVSTNQGLLEYDSKTNVFSVEPILQLKIQNKPAQIYQWAYDTLHNLYYALVVDENEEKIYTLRYNASSRKWQQVFSPLLRLHNFGAISMQFIGDALWIGGIDGLAKVERTELKLHQKMSHFSFPCIIHKVTTKNDSILFWGLNPFLRQASNFESQFVLEYNFNTINFDFAAPYFSGFPTIEYQFLLQGFDENWSNWSYDNFKSYTNLPEGRYVFQVRARNIFEQTSQTASFSFQILPPWYRTWWAYLIYVFLLFASVYFTIKNRLKRLQREKKILEEKVLERTLEIARQKEEISLKAQEIEVAYNRLNVLSIIGQELTAKLDIDSIFDAFFQHIQQLMDCDLFGIFLYRPVEEIMEVHLGSREEARKIVDKIDVKKDHHLAIWCLKNREPIIVSNFSMQYPFFFQAPISWGSSSSNIAQSQLYYPLIKDDSIIGVLTVQSFRENAYLPYHIDMIKSLGAYAVIALDNAYAYNQIGLQKKELEAAYVSISQQNENLNKAYQQIHIKNVEITDSIVYAKRIQESILTPVEEIKKILPQCFIYYRPRDIVSGDFYWFHAEDNKLIIAAVDCTGHGVPGAFMSVMASSLLNQIVIEQKIFMPEYILEELDERVRKNLHQDEKETSSADGMDLGLCMIDLNVRTLFFAGANNPMYYVSGSELRVIPANKFAIGGKYLHKKNFVSHRIDYYPGDVFYLFSDGYADQFGGPFNKKLLHRKFKEKLLEIHQFSFDIQYTLLDSFFNSWKGSNEQVDDVLVIGFGL